MDQRIIDIIQDLLRGTTSRRAAIEGIGRVVGELRGLRGDLFPNDAQKILDAYVRGEMSSDGYETFSPTSAWSAISRSAMPGALPPAVAPVPAPESVADQALRARGIDPTGALPETETDLFGAGALGTGGVTELPKYLRPETPFFDEPATWGQDYDVTPPVVGYTEPLEGQAVTQETLDIIDPPPPLTMRRLYGDAPFVQPVTPPLIQDALGLPDEAATLQERLGAGPPEFRGEPLPPGPLAMVPEQARAGLSPEMMFQQSLFRQPWADVPEFRAAARGMQPNIRRAFDLFHPYGLSDVGSLMSSYEEGQDEVRRPYEAFLSGELGGITQERIREALNRATSLVADQGDILTSPYYRHGGGGAVSNQLLQQQLRANRSNQLDPFLLAATWGQGPAARQALTGAYTDVYNRFQAENPFANFLEFASRQNLGGAFRPKEWGDPKYVAPGRFG